MRGQAVGHGRAPGARASERHPRRCAQGSRHNTVGRSSEGASGPASCTASTATTPAGCSSSPRPKPRICNWPNSSSDRSLGQRTYWALVHGGFREDTGTIDAPIARHPRDRRRMAIVEGGREAITDFRVVERLSQGDRPRGLAADGEDPPDTRPSRFDRSSDRGRRRVWTARPSLRRPALHAMRLRLRHPDDGSERSFESPVPAELIAAADRLRPLLS